MSDVSPSLTPTTAPPAEKGERGVQQAEIINAPPEIKATEIRETLRGKIIATNDDGETKITTDKGEITVKTNRPPPDGTEVDIRLIRDKTVLRTTIAVVRQQDALAKAALDTVAQAPKQLPPLKEGDTVTAIFIPRTAPETLDDAPVQARRPTALPHDTYSKPTPASQPLPVEVVAHILSAAKDASAEKLAVFAKDILPHSPGLPPLPAAVPELIQLPAQDIPAAIEKLPAPVKAEVIAFFSNPVIVDEILQQLPETVPARINITKILQSIPAQTAEGTQTVPAQTVPENDSILQKLLRFLPLPQKHASQPEGVPPSTSTPTTQSHATPQPPQRPPENILPVLEALQTGIADKSLFPTLTASAKQALPTPQNIVTLHIISSDTAQTAKESPATVTTKDTFPQKSTPQPQSVQTPLKTEQSRITGVIEAKTSSGAPLIRTDTGHFVLTTPVQAQVGDTVHFQAQPASQADILGMPPIPAAETDVKSFHPLLSPSWPALEETLITLATAAPDAAQHLRQTLPTLTPRFTPMALLFLSVMHMGDIENWLGAQTLEATGKKSLIERLAGDFTKITEQARETLPGGWRSISMPLLHDEQISQIHFFIRQQGNEEGGGEKKDADGTRFILNFSLSRMGDMQLDGYLRKNAFDLVLRTEHSLPPSAQRDMAERFQQGVEQAGKTGSLRFAAKKDGWVKIEQDTKAKHTLA
ncbi:MAG: hypothetical protein OXT65_12650 [Alphaproteobacteria bacterium]|nr:hypothetical protein [Alphaproteobacteria bacterium]